nr:putative transposase (putative), gypsy type [Tanacetum cinerariifolium]
MPNDTICDFPEGKIGIYNRFFKFANFRLPIFTFILRVLLHFGIHISQLSVLGAVRINHFEISCRAHGRVLTVHYAHAARPAFYDDEEGGRDEASGFHQGSQPMKRESMVGSSHEATDDLSSSKAGFKHLVSKGSSKTSALLSSASTHSKPLVSARPGPRFAHVSHHIPGIVFDPVQDFADTPCEDRFYASISVDPFVAKDIYHQD